MYTTLAVVAAISAWLFGFAYQKVRFSVLEREDAQQLERAETGSCSQEWLSSVSSQAAIGLVSPNTIEALVDMNLIEKPAIDRSTKYNPSLVSSLIPWLPLFFLAALAPAVRDLVSIGESNVLSAPWLLVFNLSLMAIAMADARFRIVPIPFLLALLVSGLLAFGLNDVGFYVMTFLMASVVLWLGARMFEQTTFKSDVFGLGDVFLMATVFAAFASFKDLALFAVFFGALAIASFMLVVWNLRGRKKNWKSAVALRVPLGPALAVAAVVAPPIAGMLS